MGACVCSLLFLADVFTGPGWQRRGDLLEICRRLLAGCQWSDGLDNSVGVCIIVCVCVSLGVSMLCVGIDQPLPKSSNATPHQAAATDFSSFKVNKIMFVTRFLKSLELHVI